MTPGEVDVILACHELRCGWGQAPVYQTRDEKTGRPVWTRTLTCLRGCGSKRVEKFKPSLPTQRIGTPRYLRPRAWKEVGAVYFSAARHDRILAQITTVGITTEDES